MKRKTEDFIDTFTAYARTFNCPARYAKWAGIWTVAVTLGRRVGIQTRGTFLAPNLNLIMVGGPATGKSRAVNAIKSVLSSATDYKYIPASITRAGMEDFMGGNMKMRKDPSGKELMSNECIGLSEEMQGILPDQDLGHLTLYNLLFDNPDKHQAVTRSNGEVNLEYPYCAIFTGAQPQFLSTTMPEGAWGMGFMSRAIMIWDVPNERTSMFESAMIDVKTQTALQHDLKQMFNLFGWMQWDNDAISLYNQWFVEAGGLPAPQHKRLQMGYNGRREIQMVKLAMVFAVSRSNELLVTLPDVARAIETLLEAEQQMQHIFNEMSSAGSLVAVEDVLDRVRTNWASAKHTSEADLIEMLMQRFPSNQVHSIISNLINSNVLDMTDSTVNAVGFRKYKPGIKLTLV